MSVILIGWLCSLTLAAPLVGEANAEADQELLRQITAAQIPLEGLADELQTKVRDVLRKGQLYTRGPIECFPCQPSVYRLLVDHPEWTIHGWRALGATRLRIERQTDGSCLGSDPLGGELRWRPIVTEHGRRAWYAEGTGRPAPLMPLMTVRAVVLLKFQEVRGEDGRSGIRQRAEVFALYDGKAAEMVCKVLGMSSESVGKKILEQIGLFFSGMAWYMSENPEWSLKVLPDPPPANPNPPELRQLRQQLQPLVGSKRPTRPS
ncbi:MAG TPA: hypothetical protein PKD86_15840 [Gemmatales bacterium]|nr:hypothetical protein [Gemmatales bacterium]HMP60816.1 hypothetical protein [Gemmatales bacterium]